MKDITFQALSYCNQYSFDFKSFENLYWLEQGIVVIRFAMKFLETSTNEKNETNAYLSIYNSEDPFLTDTSLQTMYPLLFTKNTVYTTKIIVHISKYIRKFNCLETPEKLISPVYRAKAVCFAKCAELMYSFQFFFF